MYLILSIDKQGNCILNLLLNYLLKIMNIYDSVYSVYEIRVYVC